MDLGLRSDAAHLCRGSADFERFDEADAFDTPEASDPCDPFRSNFGPWPLELPFLSSFGPGPLTLPVVSKEVRRRSSIAYFDTALW